MLQDRRQQIIDEIEKRKSKDIADKALFRQSMDAFREDLRKNSPELAQAVGVDIEDLYAEKLYPLWYSNSEDEEALKVEAEKAEALLKKFADLEEAILQKAAQRLGLW